MKKILTFILVSIIVLSLSACSATPQPTEQDSSKTTTQTDLPSSENSKETVSQKNAVRKAKSYLKTSSFSREGLITQLEFEKFTNEQAIYGVGEAGF